ncbi:MAG: PilT/PilU family type 4a pilus ATPase [Cyanobacteriota bacterium]|nr:PilT/PilU family type 4a pilus ATPase [Cyanobacteriota bacterium]
MSNTFYIDDFLRQAVTVGASDIHLSVGERPAIRVAGQIMRINLPPLTDEDIDATIQSIAPDNLKERISRFFDIDFAYEIPHFSRFRVNMSHQLGKCALVLRVIPYHIKAFEELNLPKTLEHFAEFNNGLVLVTGPTGSGKSTTIASLIDFINENYAKHIITIEDPVEFIFENKKSVISQRQLLIDTPSFADGVKYALRQDPDVIFIGEIRDRETIEAALNAAETGHLVVSTLHTNNAVQTVSRIVNFFEPAERGYIRQQVANTLRGTIAQKLVPTVDEDSRLPAPEILVVTPPAVDFIEKEELDKIYELVRQGSYDNMTTMNMSLYKLYEDGKITQETALYYSDAKQELEQMMRGVYHGTGVNRKY